MGRMQVDEPEWGFPRPAVQAARTFSFTQTPNNNGRVAAVKETEGESGLLRGSLCVDTQHAGGVYLQAVLGGQVHRQTWLPIHSASSCQGQNSGGGMHVCVCVSIVVYACRCRSCPRVSLYCSNFHHSLCMSQRCTLHFPLRYNDKQIFPFLYFRLRDLTKIWLVSHRMPVRVCVCMCCPSNGSEGE